MLPKAITLLSCCSLCLLGISAMSCQFMNNGGNSQTSSIAQRNSEALDPKLIAVSAQDFSAQIAASKASYDAGKNGMPFNKQFSGLGTDWFNKLNHGQKMQLGGWVTPSGQPCDLVNTLMQCERFRSAHSRLPLNGLEIITESFAESHPGMTPADLYAKNKDQRFATVGSVVNPQTGRFYTSFDGSIYEPGGIKFELLDKYEDVVKAFHGRPGAKRFMDPGVSAAWHITVYAEEKGTPLADTVIIQTSQEPPEHGTPARQPGM